jgi:hypothetical protein
MYTFVSCYGFLTKLFRQVIRIKIEKYAIFVVFHQNQLRTPPMVADTRGVKKESLLTAVCNE